MGIQMTFIQPSIKNILLSTVVLITIVFISHNLLNIRTQALITEKYTDTANEILSTTHSYIEAKKESILFIGLSLANDPRFIDAINHQVKQISCWIDFQKTYVLTPIIKMYGSRFLIAKV